ncbi:MAG: hypothetical protein ACR2F6_12375 [Mycobacteriales bacterium]
MSRRGHIWRGLAGGLAAGAAGTTALNGVTYLDMAVRGRPISSTPEDTAEKLAALAGIEIPGEEETRNNRLAGLGPLTGIASGLGVGAALGLSRALGFRPRLLIAGVLAAAGAMAGTDAPMAALGVTDPGSWDAKGWLTDAIPHLVYGLVTAAVVERLER